LAPERTDILDACASLVHAQQMAQTKAGFDVARSRKQVLFLRYVPIGCLLLGFILASVILGLPHSHQPSPDWAGIVQRRLDANSLTRVLDLKSTSRGGVVQVVGQVPNELYRQLVLEIANRDVLANVNTEELTLAPPPPLETYQISTGDSWWSIARREYGSARAWPQLANANRPKGAPRQSLRPGQTIVLPPITVTPR
jgi:LysM repeat protein